jgi:hypothetical protein
MRVRIPSTVGLNGRRPGFSTLGVADEADEIARRPTYSAFCSAAVGDQGGAE